MMFPIHLYEGQELPSEGTYYVVAGNGLYLHKDNGLFKGFVAVNQISVLEDFQPAQHLRCFLPKIPFKLVWQAKKFFEIVVAQLNSESVVTLCFNPESQEYKLHANEQRVSHGGLGYRRGLLPLEGYLQVGTIHSHADFHAFHSGTDDSDEEFFDGLHITFGHCDRDLFTISASIVLNGHRTLVRPVEYLEGVASNPEDFVERFQIDQTPEEEWITEVQEWLTKVQGYA